MGLEDLSRFNTFQLYTPLDPQARVSASSFVAKATIDEVVLCGAFVSIGSTHFPSRFR